MWPFRKKKQTDMHLDGQNLTLVRETPWLRHYTEGQVGTFVDSRFRDGSATITLAELKRQWPRWTSAERSDFCLAFWHGDVPERCDILRFLIENGDSSNHCMLALQIAVHLPAEESVPILIRWCEATTIGQGANFLQALGMTKSDEAAEVLQRRLARTWSRSDLMEEVDFCNWTAYDAICCMEALLRLGADPESLRAQYDQLLAHPFARTRAQAEQHLSEFFN